MQIAPEEVRAYIERNRAKKKQPTFPSNTCLLRVGPRPQFELYWAALEHQEDVRYITSDLTRLDAFVLALKYAVELLGVKQVVLENFEQYPTLTRKEALQLIARFEKSKQRYRHLDTGTFSSVIINACKQKPVSLI